MTGIKFEKKKQQICKNSMLINKKKITYKYIIFTHVSFIYFFVKFIFK